jgi:guanylate kinase
MDEMELKKLVDSYQPSPEAIKAMANVKLLATVGPSASGKNTIMKVLAKISPDIHFVAGETSRERRPNEQSGVDLIFRSKAQILADLKDGKLTQVVIGPNGDLYCTRVDNFASPGIGVLPLIPLGVKQFRALPLKFFAAAFIVPESFESWQQWLSQQTKDSGWDVKKLAGRLAEAKKSYEFALNDGQISFILNDTPEKAANRLLQVSRGQAPNDEAQARKTAEGNYEKLLEILNKSSI